MLRIFGALTKTPSPTQEQEQEQEQVTLPVVASNGHEPAPEPEAQPAEAPAANPEVSQVKTPAGGPRLFVQSNYVAAIRASDGTVLSRGVAARPSEVVELYGTGFKTGGDTGKDSPDASAAGGDATVSIGGVLADLEFAGFAGPSLYQFNVTVPAGLPGGDHAVIASVGGISTQHEALLKIASASDLANHQGRYSGFMQKATDGVFLASNGDSRIGPEA